MSVLVLEAGGPDTDPQDPPAVARTASSPGRTSTGSYATEEEPHLGGRRIAWPRGKVWGGSGSLSATVYVRGHPADFDAWEAAGNPGWGWDGRPALVQEGREPRAGAVGAPRHGRAPERGRPPVGVAPLARVPAAAGEAGLRRHDDFNGEAQDGAALYALNQKNGERHSAADAYLRPALHRKNLTVESHALATRILLEGGRAVGVAYRQDGTEREARARARGHPVRRDDRVGAAPAALRDRPAPSTSARSASRWCATSRASGRTCRTTRGWPSPASRRSRSA